MERRYDDAYSVEYPTEETTSKMDAYYNFSNFLSSDESEASFTFGDFIQAFGPIARTVYDFQTDELQLSWVILEEENEEGLNYEFLTNIQITSGHLPSTLENLNEIEVNDLRRDIIFKSDPLLLNADFIGQ